jgi:hypothetical protein
MKKDACSSETSVFAYKPEDLFKKITNSSPYILQPEDIGSMFFRNVGFHLQNYKVEQLKRPR